MKKLSIVLLLAAIALFGVMCFNIGYNYCILQIGVNSAPVWTALFLSMPFIPVIVLLVLLARTLYYKTNHTEEQKNEQQGE